jgi:peptide/nickel transport system permease protein
MRRYIFTRVLWAVPTLLLVSIVIFSMVRVIPGDAITAQFTSQGNISQKDVQKARNELGLNEPAVKQYFVWLGGIVRGNFGDSLVSRSSVTERIRKSLPVSLEIALIGITISILLAIPIGILSALKAGTILDYAGRLVALLGLAVPAFWLGILLLVMPSVWFHYLPPLRYVPFVDQPLTNLQQFILPGFAVGFVSAAALMRMTRSSMLDVIRADHVRTARAKGLSERLVVLRHAFRLATIPIVTILGTQVASLITGTVIIEQVFALPGSGRLLLQAINQRDYPMIQAIVLAAACLVLLVNLLVDLSYVGLDPRIRLTN